MNFGEMEGSVAMDRSVPSYMHFWGKAGGERWHPLVFHMLDVAAVAREVLEREPESTKRRASRLFLSEKEFSDSISFLAAMHDLAKFSKDFQWKIPELATQLSGENPVRITASHHTTFAWGIWKKVARPFLVEKYPAFGKSNESDWLNPLLTASFGHHGVPTDYRIQSPDYTNSFFNQLIADQEIVAIKTFLLDLLDLFPGARVIFESPEMLTKNRHEWNVFSFYLSGLIVLADWTASSELNFHWKNTGKKARAMQKRLSKNRGWVR
jgi:CRISPR-associated endonuclease/helicase Cas3